MGKQIQNYSLQVQLGQGVYSKVYKAINTITKQEVAIKMVKADKFKQMPKLEQGTINQINTLTSLKPCPNIIRYFDMLKTVNNFYFVYEYCNGGTLEKILKKNNSQGLGQKHSLIYFRQLINAFKILAQNNIMHRDIKPENILIHNDILKIADFGFCKPLQHSDGMAQTMLGSPIYMAPQVLKGQTYTMKADVWSLGVVLYRMVFGFCPFQSNNIGKLILMLNENQLKIPDTPKISQTLQQLIRRMLTKDPKKRADWNQNGQLLDPKNRIQGNKIYQSTTCSLKASTAGSLQSNKSPHLLREQNNNQQCNIRRIKKVQSPKHHESTSGYKGQKNFNKTHLMPMPVPGPDSSLRDTFKSKSPLRGTITTNRYSKKDVHIKNHRKCIQLSSMAIQVANYQCNESTPVAYFLCKVIQRQFLMLKDSIRKDGFPTNNNNNITSTSFKNSDQGFLLDLDNIINQQLRNLGQIIFILEGMLNQLGVRNNQVIDNRRRYLKRFIQSINNLSNKQQLSLCHQLLDYVLEDILINKKTYQKLKEQQMHRKIIEKIQEIN